MFLCVKNVKREEKEGMEWILDRAVEGMYVGQSMDVLGFRQILNLNKIKPFQCINGYKRKP